MKLQRSTTVLINVVLILIIVMLAKSIVGVPKNVYAATPTEYKVVRTDVSQTEKILTDSTKEGWRFVTSVNYHEPLDPDLIFQR
jgi:hypothetical protein